MKTWFIGVAAMAPLGALAHSGHAAEGSLLHSLGHGGEPLALAIALAAVAGWLLYRGSGRD